MDSSVCHLISPLVGLSLQISEVSKGSQGSEVVPDVMDGSLFDFSFLLRPCHGAGFRDDPKGTQEFQKGLVKAHKGALTLGDCGNHIVVKKLSWGPLEEMEGTREAPMESFLSLRVGKLNIEHAAMRLDDGQAVEFSFGVPIAKGAEVAPVDLTLLTWGRLKADDSLPLFGWMADLSQIFSQDGDAPGESQITKALMNDHSRGLGIDLKYSADGVSEGIKLAFPFEFRSLGIRVFEVLPYGLSTDPEGF